jgi:hypothetical protein
MTKIRITIVLTYFYKRDLFALNLTEFRDSLVYCPVYTQTPELHKTFFNVLPFRMRLAGVKGSF